MTSPSSQAASVAALLCALTLSAASTAQTVAGPEPPAPPPPEAEAELDDALTTFGVRASVLRAQETSWGLTFAGRAMQYSTNLPYLSWRGGGFWGLGGGSGDFEASLGGALALGGRLPVGKSHGPVLRAGLEGYLLGNDLLYASMFELPQLQLGYQRARGRELFELGAKGGAVLTGRYNDPEREGRRVLGAAFEWGAYGSFHVTPARIDVSFTRVEARQTAPGGPVDVIDGAACGIVSFVAVCLDARYQRGDVRLPGGGSDEVQTMYAGLTIGLASRRDGEGELCVTDCPK